MFKAWSFKWVIGFGAGMLLLGSGCQSPRTDPFAPFEGVQRVWPAPPEKARIAYVGSITGQADLEKSSSWLRDLIFGKRELGVLVTPYAVTVNDDGTLFVADTGAALVHCFDLRHRTYRQFKTLVGGATLKKPIGLAAVGHWLYVVDSSLHQVCVFDQQGTPLFVFGAQRFVRPTGIACDPQRKQLYVTDTARHVVEVFDLQGHWTRTLGGRGAQAGTFNYPTQLWVDHQGRLYVSDTLNYRIQVFDPDGNEVNLFGVQGNRPGNFAHPCGVATDREGHIYVTDRQFENVQIFDSDGQVLLAFGHEGQQPGEFWLPAGLFIDDKNRIFVADTFNKRIQIFKLLQESTP